MADTIFPAFAPGAQPELTDGVFVFATASTAETDETRDRLTRLNRTAREKDWFTALQEVFGERGNVDYVTNEQRLGFLPTLPLAPDQAILEIGASLGQIAIPLARRVKSVDALEVVVGQATFCLERARQEGLANMRIAAGGEDCYLPYADASFDGVVLNLVLEWCADRVTDDHELAQRRLLAEIGRVLKPGGFLYLNTKNRFALRLLFGGRDEHMHGLRWGNALPRPIARLLSSARPRGRLHSQPYLKRMLREAGFGRIDGYWAAPEMRKPKALIPLQPQSLRAQRRSGNISQGPSRATRLAMALVPDGLVRFFTPGLTFIAYR